VPVRRGVPVTPAKAEWIIKRCAADLTSRSLQTAPTSGALREPDAPSASLRVELITRSLRKEGPSNAFF